MQCNECGKQLPPNVAFCPNCGSVTQSMAATSDTMVSSFPGEVSQYPPHNPYAESTSPPPPPPGRRPSAGRIVLLVILVLVVIGAGSVLFFRAISPSGQAQHQATPTTQAQQATVAPSPTLQPTATPTALTPQDLYAQITAGTPVLDDPMSTNDTNNWTEGGSSDGTTVCKFSGGAYHAVAQPQNAYSLCVAQATNFDNLAYQVQMNIVKGEFGGMVFRADGSQTKYYSFFIDRYGNYTLITSVDSTGTHDYVLRKGTSKFIKTGLNQVNLLSVVAQGKSIYLYINGQYLTSASDTRYSIGQIGVFGGNVTKAPADVVFSHVQVWKV
jgi:hypothetical protein